jgi:hypothetical protein
VWRIEDVLELYDPKWPVVCFDELPYQMVAEKRTPLPQKPGSSWLSVKRYGKLAADEIQ